jgi:hypothetical protein
MQVATVEEADGAEALDRLRRGRFPRAFEIAFELLCPDLRHRDEPDERMTRSGSLEVARVGLPERPSHVGLAGAHPDLAHEHILHDARAGPGDLDRLRSRVRGHRRQLDLPAAIAAGLRGRHLAGECHRNDGAGSIPAPDRIRLFLLQDHVIADDGGQFQLSPKQGTEQETAEEREADEFHRVSGLLRTLHGRRSWAAAWAESQVVLKLWLPVGPAGCEGPARGAEWRLGRVRGVRARDSDWRGRRRGRPCPVRSGWRRRVSSAPRCRPCGFPASGRPVVA